MFAVIFGLPAGLVFLAVLPDAGTPAEVEPLPVIPPGQFRDELRNLRPRADFRKCMLPDLFKRENAVADIRRQMGYRATEQVAGGGVARRLNGVEALSGGKASASNGADVVV